MAARRGAARPTRRWGSGTAAIVRVLIAAREPLTQVAIAEATRITQPRVSQVLKRLAEHGSVRSNPRGYSATKRARLLDLYREQSRPALTRPEEPWYGTATLLDQVRGVLALASQRGVDVAVSADVGPDLLVPWRHPTLAIIYSARVLDLSAARLVPAEGRADASLLRPFPPWISAVEGVPLTDPVQQWCDLLDLGGDDRREAADRLRQAILDRAVLAVA